MSYTRALIKHVFNGLTEAIAAGLLIPGDDIRPFLEQTSHDAIVDDIVRSTCSHFEELAKSAHNLSALEYGIPFFICLLVPVHSSFSSS